MPVRRIERTPLVAPSGLAAVTDGILDGALAAFALWTLFYQVALGLQVSLWPVVWLWLPPAVLAVVAAIAWNVRVASRARAARQAGPPDVESPTLTSHAAQDDRMLDGRPSADLLRLAVLLVAALAVGGVALRVVGDTERFLLLWAVSAGALAVVGVGVLTGRMGAPERLPRPSDAKLPAFAEDAAVLGVAAALAVFSSLLLNTDADDVYYVNRSVWVAEHGTPSLRDTMFGAETLPSNYGGGLPLPSVEALFGALAHTVDVSAGSMTYLVVTPLVAVAFVWATWRLIREWASRRRLLALVVTFAFVLAMGASVVGNYSFGRLWQGKVIAVCVVVPLIWTFATRLARARSRYDAFMLFVLGVSFVGLTSVAALLATVMAAALVVAAAVLRSVPLAVGSALLGAAPVLSGLVLTQSASQVGGEAPVAPEPWQAFGIVFGWQKETVALALVALVVAPLLVRRGAPAVLALAASAVVVVSLAPGLLWLVNEATGSGAVAWRLLLAAPLAPLVGLLVAADWGFTRRSVDIPVTVAVALVLVAALSSSRTPVWSSEIGAEITSRPTWKVSQEARADVLRIIRMEEAGDGPLLLPPQHMSTLAVTTTRTFAVVPRVLYVQGLAEPPATTAARLRLLALVTGVLPRPPVERTARDLEVLDVTLVCATRRGVARHVRRAGYEPYRRVNGLMCLRRGEG